jgi:hypothetical protein
MRVSYIIIIIIIIIIYIDYFSLTYNIKIFIL